MIEVGKSEREYTFSSGNHTAGVNDWLKVTEKLVLRANLGLGSSNPNTCIYPGVLHSTRSSAIAKTTPDLGRISSMLLPEPTPEAVEAGEALWDARVERDARSGKLDKLMAKVREAYSKGDYTDL